MDNILSFFIKGLADIVSNGDDNVNESEKDFEETSNTTQQEISKYLDTGRVKSVHPIKCTATCTTTSLSDSYTTPSLSDHCTTSGLPASLPIISSSRSCSTTTIYM